MTFTDKGALAFIIWAGVLLFTSAMVCVDEDHRRFGMKLFKAGIVCAIISTFFFIGGD